MMMEVNFKNNLIQTDAFNSDIIKTIHASFPIAVKQAKQNNFYKYFDKGNAKDTAHAVWLFLRKYIVYKRDEDNNQLILLPGRLVHERLRGSETFNPKQTSDCKSFALFAAAMMAANGYKVAFRYTGYKGGTTPTHVYIYLPEENIIIDGCYKDFNKEKQYTNKEDYIMNTYILSGINGKKKGKKDGKPKGVKKIALAVPRNSFLGLVKLNVFGLATKLKAAVAKNKKAVTDKWLKLGGKPEALLKEIERGAKKKAILGGKKTKEIAKGLKGIDDPKLRQQLRAQVKKLIELRQSLPPGDPRIKELTTRILIIKDSITGINAEPVSTTTFATVAAAAAPVLVAISGMLKSLGIGKGDPTDPNDISLTDILDTAGAAGGNLVDPSTDEFEVTDKDKGMAISPIILIAGLGIAAFLFLGKKK